MYSKINGYKHLIVNHSLEFKNKETEARTNTVKGMWGHAKLTCLKFNRNKFHFPCFPPAFI